MNEKDGIDLGVEDKNTPNIRLPDIEIGGAFKRLCKRDDIKEYIYTAADKHKKMSRDPWKNHTIQGLITTVALVSSAIIIKLLL